MVTVVNTAFTAVLFSCPLPCHSLNAMHQLESYLHSQTWCVPDVLISCARTAVFLWTVALQWLLMSVRQIVSRLLLCHWPQLLPSTSEFISDLCWAKIYTYIYGTCYTRSWNYAVFYLLVCLVDDYVHCALLTYAYTNEMWVSRICNFLTTF